MEKHVRVGVGVFIFKDGKFLMLKRKGSHGDGSWSVPGGHLEFNESFEKQLNAKSLKKQVYAYAIYVLAP